jgi:hypothetical protein
VKRGICSLSIALTACDRAGPPPADQQVSLRVEGRSNGNPSIAAAGDLVAVAWSASTRDTTDVFAAVSRDGGRSFGAPARVNDIPGDARINSEFPPRIAIVPQAGGGPEIVVVWTTARGADSRMLWARSTDGGATFVDRQTVPGSEARGSRGWESVAVDSAGRVLVLWLDHRDVSPMAAMHHHGASSTTATATTEDPTERAGPSKLYFTALTDSQPVIITGSVCYCCKTSLVASGSSVYGVWRHVYPGAHRNIAFTQSRDGGKTFAAPVQVSDDHWAIDGCPENGPAIAVDDRIHVVWATPPDGKSDTPLGVFYAASTDGSKFEARAPMPTRGAGSHVQIVSEGDGSLVVAWDEIVGAERQVGLARVMDKPGAPPRIARLWGDAHVAGGWPILARAGSTTLVAWVSKLGTSSEIVVTSLH